MSNFIPMVSSSPPPLDEGAGFDDWGDEDGDDFGNFMGADSTTHTVDKDPGVQWGGNNNSEIIDDKNIPQFADFAKFSSDSGKIYENRICVENHASESNHNGDDHSIFPNSDSGTALDSPLSDSEVNIQGNVNSDCDQNPGDVMNQSSTVDSGLSVSDVTLSPGAKSEHCPESEKSENNGKTNEIIEAQGNVKSEIREDCEDFEEFQSPEDLKHNEDAVDNESYLHDISNQQNDLSHPQNMAAHVVSNSASQVQNSEENKLITSGRDEDIETCNHCAEPEVQCENLDQVCAEMVNNEESQFSQSDSNLVCDNSVNHQKSETSESENVTCTESENNLLAHSSETFSHLKDEEDSGREESSSRLDSLGEDGEDACENKRTERSDLENHTCNDETEEISVDSVSSDKFTDHTENSTENACLGENHENKNQDIGETSVHRVHSEKDETSDLDGECDEFADFSSAPVNEVAYDGEDKKSCEEKVTRSSDNDDDDDFDDFTEFSSSEKSKDDMAMSNAVQENDSGEHKDFKTDKSNEDGDDFENFSSAPHSNNNDNEAVSTVNNNDNEAVSTVNFGAFESNNSFAAFGEEVTEGESGGGNWAAFNDQASEDQLVTNADDDDEEFSDFDNFQAVPLTKEPDVVKPTVAGVDNVFTITFPVSMVTGSKSENGVQLMNDDMVAESTNTEILWSRLKRLDRGTSVLKWNDAKSNKNLFTSLKIDTRNILISHKKSVPIYAANLTLGGVLEPTKGPVKSIQSAASDSTLIDTNKPDTKPQIQESNKPRSNVGSKSTSEVTLVQFDWSSAGLTNPLESSNKTLDLDFLVMAETEAVTRSGVSDSELMHGQKPTLQPLENILANLKVTTVKRGRQDENLGEETRRIIDSLPDLSFMHSKVLMFPLRHQSDP